MAKSVVRGLLLDLGVLAGLALIALGIFDLSTSAGWIFVGAIIVVVHLILAERTANPPPSAPKGDR
jgi:hypothetical protein